MRGLASRMHEWCGSGVVGLARGRHLLQLAVLVGSAAMASVSLAQQSGEVLRPEQVFWPVDPRAGGGIGASLSVDGEVRSGHPGNTSVRAPG